MENENGKQKNKMLANLQINFLIGVDVTQVSPDVNQILKPFFVELACQLEKFFRGKNSEVLAVNDSIGLVKQQEMLEVLTQAKKDFFDQLENKKAEPKKDDDDNDGFGKNRIIGFSNN